jgi:hypothetical protein
VLVHGGLAICGQEREVAPSIRLERLEHEVPDLLRGVRLLLLELKKALPPGFDDDL